MVATAQAQAQAEVGARRTTAMLSAGSAMTFVVLFGLVSLFADMTYEGGRSLTGQYLKLLGSSAAAVGIAAGAGEFLGYGLRFLSGAIADRTGLYWPITLVGYAINLVAIPSLAFTGAWPVAVGLMFAERIGKGIRNPSRDAMLSYATKEMGRGWGYGLHEAMDRAGACLGPLVMAAVLYFRGMPASQADTPAEIPAYQFGFSLLFIPAALALVMLAVAWVQFPRPHDLESKTPRASAEGLPRRYWLYLAASGLIGAGFADFALMAYHLKATGMLSDQVIPIFYAAAMFTMGIWALVAGKLYDRLGFPMVIGVFAVSLLFAPLVFFGNMPLVLLGLLLWGLGMAAQGSVMRAALADMVPKERRAYGFGLFAMAFGLFWFAGSALMGVLYDQSVPLLVAFSVAVQILALPVFIWAKNAPDPSVAAA